jgi:hypothetical protein
VVVVFTVTGEARTTRCRVTAARTSESFEALEEEEEEEEEE